MRAAAIRAIALLSLRSAIRSRLVVALAAVLLVIVVALPAALQSDGTVTGEVRIVLVYCLGLSSLLLGAVNLWASCGAISQDIQGKQISLVVVKPVHRVEIWLGRWLGLLLLNAVLLLLVTAAVFLMLYFKLHPSRTSEPDRRAAADEILVGRQRIQAETADIERETRRRFEELKTAGCLPPHIPTDVVLAVIRRRVTAEKVVVAPGKTVKWHFAIPRKIPKEAPTILQIRLVRSAFQRNPLTGTWTVGPTSNPEAITWEVRNQLVPVQNIPLSYNVVKAAAEADDPQQRLLVVKYTNGGDEKTGAAIFDATRGIEILITRSSFVPNLLRAVLVIFCKLALISALGLTAGSIFSFPVAAFVVLSALLSACVSRYLTFSVAAPAHAHCHGDSLPAPLLLEKIGEKLARVTQAVVEPVMRFDPLERLAEGLLVSWGMTAEAVLFLLVLLPGCLAALSGWILWNRELALPT